MSEDEEAQPDWPFAVELAAMPEVWSALLQLTRLPFQVGLAPHRPCTPYRAAAQARRISVGDPGGGSGKPHSSPASPGTWLS